MDHSCFPRLLAVEGQKPGDALPSLEVGGESDEQESEEDHQMLQAVPVGVSGLARLGPCSGLFE